MHIFFFGLGYIATALAELVRTEEGAISGSVRSVEKCRALRARGLDIHVLSDETVKAVQTEGVEAAAPLLKALATATHIVHSIPPDDNGMDPALRLLGERAVGARLLESGALRWLCYLSSTAVYGDRQGAEVDENTPLLPLSPEPTFAEQRGWRRARAEQLWREWAARHGVPAAFFRLAGIYGPGRNSLIRLRAGTARRIVKPGQRLGRIHRDDIVSALRLGAAAPERAVGIFNLCDDEPSDPAEVTSYAAALLGIPPPPVEDWETVKRTLSPLALSFYEGSRIVRARRTKQILGWQPRYPNYRVGLEALLAANEGGVSET